VADRALALRLRRAEAALVAIVPELERKLEQKDQTLAEAEQRLSSLQAQLHGNGCSEQQRHQQQRQQQELQHQGLMARLEERDVALANAEQRLCWLQKQLDKNSQNDKREMQPW